MILLQLIEHPMLSESFTVPLAWQPFDNITPQQDAGILTALAPHAETKLLAPTRVLVSNDIIHKKMIQQKLLYFYCFKNNNQIS